VTPRLQHWKNYRSISIYSSGSVFAQKLLFRHVSQPTSNDANTTINLESLVSEWFDTTNAGMKMEKSSYVKIAQVLGCNAEKVLFLSDNVKEVRAAREAGMRALIVDRPGNAPVSQEDRRELGAVESLQEVEIR